MKCDNCGDPDATVHQIHVADNQIEHVQLCESCAEEDQSVPESSSAQSVGEFFSDLQDQDSEETKDECPKCGLTLRELKKTNKVGCSNCYSVFRDQFESIVHRIHGADQHLGEEPETADSSEFDPSDGGSTGLGKVSREQKLQLLEKRLQKRVDEEDYEAAADLRDRIQELKEGDADEFTD